MRLYHASATLSRLIRVLFFTSTNMQMATENTRALREDPARNKAILDRIPAGRWGTPEDLQGVAVFLASAASDYMQGYTIAVDGGWLAR